MVDPRFKFDLLIGPGALKYNEIGRTSPTNLSATQAEALLDADAARLSRVLHTAGGAQNYGMVCRVSELAFRAYCDALDIRPDAANSFARVACEAAMALPRESQQVSI